MNPLPSNLLASWNPCTCSGAPCKSVPVTVWLCRCLASVFSMARTQFLHCHPCRVCVSACLFDTYVAGCPLVNLSERVRLNHQRNLSALRETIPRRQLQVSEHQSREVLIWKFESCGTWFLAVTAATRHLPTGRSSDSNCQLILSMLRSPEFPHPVPRTLPLVPVLSHVTASQPVPLRSTVIL